MKISTRITTMTTQGAKSFIRMLVEFSAQYIRSWMLVLGFLFTTMGDQNPPQFFVLN